MITVESLLVRIAGLQAPDLERWIAQGWLRPEHGTQPPLFREIDAARAALLRDLEQDLAVDDDALPLILSLLDQLYQSRRQMRRLAQAVATAAPDDVRQRIAEHMRGMPGEE